MDPRQQFLRAADAAEATPRVRYRFDASVAGAEEERHLEGTVVIERLDLSGARFRARLEATETSGDTGEPRRLEAVRHYDDVYLLDFGDRVVDYGSLYAGGGSLLYRLDPALMYAFFDPKAVATEADATQVVLLGRDEIRGESCDLIHVTYDDDEEDSRWCLGTDDGLPRLMEWIGPDSRTTLEIFDIEPLGELAEDAFAVDIPAGWARREKTVGPPLGSRVAGWKLPTASGGSLALEDLRGQVVVLDFWATWCSPCLTTLDNLQELQGSYLDRPVRLIAVNVMESGDPQAFLSERGYTFDALLDGDELHDRIAPGSLPAFAVIDADGKWAGAGVGYFGDGSKRYLTQLIDRALSSDR